MLDRRQRLADAHLYLVCGARSDEFLRAALRGGVDIVQLRMKDARKAEIVATAERFAALCREAQALFILNDRPDLAAYVGADGAHVGQDDMPAHEARRLIGPDRLLGLSTHALEEVLSADTAVVDYIGVGPVHETPTKAGRPAVGLDLVRFAAEQAVLPFFAIGGINAGNVAAVRQAGASRIAVVRSLTEAGDPESAAAQLRSAIVQEQTVGSAQP